MKKVYLRKNKGITLIALVITIIVLLILAGVAIAMLSGENGILKKAAESKIKTEQAQKEEETRLADMETTANFLTNNISYKIKNGYMTGFTVGEKVSEINKKLKSLGYEINLKYNIGQGKDIPIENEEDQPIATGMSVQKDGKTVARTIVFGDCNCDGTMNNSDSVTIGRLLKVKDKRLIFVFLIQSMDADHNGKINMKDKDLIGANMNDNNVINQNEYTINDKEMKVIYEEEIYKEYIDNELPESFKNQSIYKIEYNEKNKVYELKGATTDTEASDITSLFQNAKVTKSGNEVTKIEEGCSLIVGIEEREGWNELSFNIVI